MLVGVFSECGIHIGTSPQRQNDAGKYQQKISRVKTVEKGHEYPPEWLFCIVYPLAGKNTSNVCKYIHSLIKSGHPVSGGMTMTEKDYGKLVDEIIGFDSIKLASCICTICLLIERILLYCHAT